MGNSNTKKVHADPANSALPALMGVVAVSSASAGGQVAAASAAKAAASVPWYVAAIVAVAVVATAIGVGVGLTVGNASESVVSAIGPVFSPSTSPSPSHSPSRSPTAVAPLSSSSSPTTAGLDAAASGTPSASATRVGSAASTEAATLSATVTATLSATYSPTALPELLYTVRTLAGVGYDDYADGVGTEASFASPLDVVYHPSGVLYVADTGHHMIRVINCTDKRVTTFIGNGNSDNADGFGTAAHINMPIGMTLSANNDRLYVSASGSHQIKVISLATAELMTLAGSTVGLVDAHSTSAKFNYPAGIIPYGTQLFIMDTSNNVIRIFSFVNGEVTTFAGSTQGLQDGIGTAAKFFSASFGVLDGLANLWVVDTNNNAIRKINITTAQVETVAGGALNTWVDGIGTSASFHSPFGIAIDTAGHIFISELDVMRVRHLNSTTYQVTSLVGQVGTLGFADGTGSAATFSSPAGICVDNKGLVYVADRYNSAIRYFRYAW